MAIAPSKIVRYAVVGLGSFAQMAILPAFKHARKNSKLVAFFSGDSMKRKKLGQRYHVDQLHSYDHYEDGLLSANIDAVYIALPNTLHKEFAVRAAKAGCHILCEKPLALTENDGREIIDAAEQNRVKLMTAYRLHFEETNLSIIDLIKKRKIGEPRFFSSVFSHQVRPGDIRTQHSSGGGGLWDLGVYCINAARYLFRAEPTDVFAMTANTDPKRFHGVDELAAAILRFPKNRVAQFITSQGAGDSSQYRIVGTRGDIQADPAFEYAEGNQFTLTVGSKKTMFKKPKRDQVAAELLYFSDCILKNKNPEPSGWEGLLDVRVIEALYRSAKTGLPVHLSPMMKNRRPIKAQQITKPPIAHKNLVHAQSPSL